VVGTDNDPRHKALTLTLNRSDMYTPWVCDDVDRNCQVYDTFSSDLRGVSEESFTSTENATIVYLLMEPRWRPLGVAIL
jgi:hypothetical protein